MPRAAATPILIAAAVLLLGACSRAPVVGESAVPPGVSLQPPPSAPATGSLVLPGATDSTAANVQRPDTAAAPGAATPPAVDTAVDTTGGTP